mmetsp:Transcript_20335/g.20020  ORF Transcript_20335/g.20020 Transcript_20335/m.20020 type:complete len:182 (+) Transcript_20335:206-751(+)
MSVPEVRDCVSEEYVQLVEDLERTVSDVTDQLDFDSRVYEDVDEERRKLKEERYTCFVEKAREIAPEMYKALTTRLNLDISIHSRKFIKEMKEYMEEHRTDFSQKFFTKKISEAVNGYLQRFSEFEKFKPKIIKALLKDLYTKRMESERSSLLIKNKEFLDSLEKKKIKKSTKKWKKFLAN